MSKPVYVDKSKIVAVLRARQLDARADWVDRTLPDLVDVDKNAALFQTLGIDLDAVLTVGAEGSRGP